MNAKHTPEPWRVGPYDESQIAYQVRRNGFPFDVMPVLAAGPTKDEAAANAYLIAAAPELLDALRGLVEWPALQGCADTRVAKARAAIKKATGEDLTAVTGREIDRAQT